MSETAKAWLGRAWSVVSSVRFLAIAFVGLAGVYGAAAEVGANIPRWAWVSELSDAVDVLDEKILKVASTAKANQIELIEQALRNWKAERRIISREKAAARERGEPPAPRLLQDEEEANDEIDKLENKLEKIRGF